MAVQIIWSPLALSDLKQIDTYIRLDNPTAATALIKDLTTKVDLLHQFPEMGRVVPERVDPSVREIIFRQYRIVYRYSSVHHLIEISRVWHGARGDLELNDPA